MQTRRRGFERRRTVLGLPQPVAEALGYALVAVLCAWLGISGLWTAFRLVPEYGSPWWTLAAALPAAALACAKRRAPLAGCVAAAALFAVDLAITGGIVPFIVLLDLLYALTVSLDAVRRRRVLVVVGAATAAMTVLSYAATRDLRVTALIGLQVGALLGTTYWYGTAVAQSRELVELHRRQAEDATRLAELDRITAVRGERERMARELHDVVAGHVAAVAIRSEAALADADPRPGDGESGRGVEHAERAALRAVRDSSLDAHEALRAMIRVLRDGADGFVAPPGTDRLPAMIEEARRSGVRVVLSDRLDGQQLGDVVDQAVARVVHEGLANAVKHASGSDVDVVIAPDPAEASGSASSGPRARAVRAEVRSRGGAPIARPELRGSGLGLVMLEERVRALGGDFAAGPSDDGWVVRARLPLQEEAR
ncbi:sensor histidine kinase [Leucobacter zeae]|nr:sensor histidine kinase [Leucobacter zeae]